MTDKLVQANADARSAPGADRSDEALDPARIRLAQVRAALNFNPTGRAFSDKTLLNDAADVVKKADAGRGQSGALSGYPADSRPLSSNVSPAPACIFQPAQALPRLG